MAVPSRTGLISGKDAGRPVEFSTWAFRVDPERGPSFRVIFYLHAGTSIAVRVPKGIAKALGERIAANAIELIAAEGEGARGKEEKPPRTRRGGHLETVRAHLAEMWEAYQEPEVRICDLVKRFGGNVPTISSEFKRVYGREALLLRNRKRAVWATKALGKTEAKNQ